MSDDRTSLWMVGETGYEDFDPHAVFAVEADAKAYAEAIGDDVHELPLYGPGELPEFVEAWSAEAAIRQRRTTHTSSTSGGKTTMTVLDNVPPSARLHRFSTLGHVPAWARQPCDVTNCEAADGQLYIRFHGSDRDAVLEACRQRYEAGLDAMGARR